MENKAQCTTMFKEHIRLQPLKMNEACCIVVCNRPVSWVLVKRFCLTHHVTRDSMRTKFCSRSFSRNSSKGARWRKHIDHSMLPRRNRIQSYVLQMIWFPVTVAQFGFLSLRLQRLSTLLARVQDRGDKGLRFGLEGPGASECEQQHSISNAEKDHTDIRILQVNNKPWFPESPLSWALAP